MPPAPAFVLRSQRVEPYEDLEIRIQAAVAFIQASQNEHSPGKLNLQRLLRHTKCQSLDFEDVYKVDSQSKSIHLKTASFQLTRHLQFVNTLIASTQLALVPEFKWLPVMLMPFFNMDIWGQTQPL